MCLVMCRNLVPGKYCVSLSLVEPSLTLFSIIPRLYRMQRCCCGWFVFLYSNWGMCAKISYTEILHANSTSSTQFCVLWSTCSCLTVCLKQRSQCRVFLQECCWTREAGTGRTCFHWPASSEIDRLQEESLRWYRQEICAHQPEGTFLQLGYVIL